MTDIQKAKKKLDIAFSILIRERDKDLPCITCGASGRQMDAGHFRRRECMSTRWDYKNCNSQCSKCNRFESRGYEYGINLDKRWGKGTAKELFHLSMKMKNWTAEEINQLTDAAKRGYRIYVQLFDELK